MALTEEDLWNPSNDDDISEGKIWNKRNEISLLQARKFIYMILQRLMHCILMKINETWQI